MSHKNFYFPAVDRPFFRLVSSLAGIRQKIPLVGTTSATLPQPTFIMAITTDYQGEFIVIKMSGSVSLPELLEHADELAAIEASQTVTPHRIAVLPGGLVCDLNFTALHAFAAKRRGAPLKNPVKSAIVAGDAVQFGFARMYQALNEHPYLQVEIFQSEAVALAWLRE